MGRNTPYSLDFMLKIKKINPNFEFTGVDKKRWEEFLESQKEDSLIDTIENMVPAENPKRKKKSKKGCLILIFYMIMKQPYCVILFFLLYICQGFFCNRCYRRNTC